MNAGKRPQGYTIIEVLIVMAVSGLMFIIAANFISGKEDRTAFTSGVNEMASRLQDTIDQVSDGKYSDIQLDCTHSPGSTTINPGSHQQGTNAECIFMGKALHFSFTNLPNRYEIFSLAGGRLNNNDLLIADPRPILALTTTQTIPQQLGIIPGNPLEAWNADGSVNAFTYGIAFLQGLGSTDAATGNQANGPQPVRLYYISSFNNANWDMNQAASNISGATLVKASKVRICLTDGDRFAHIDLGINNNQLGPKEKYYPRGVASCTDPFTAGANPG